MANIEKLPNGVGELLNFVNGETPLNAERMNPIVIKINEIIDFINGDDSQFKNNVRWITYAGDSIRTYGFWDITNSSDFKVKVTNPSTSAFKMGIILRNQEGMNAVDNLSGTYENPASGTTDMPYINTGIASADSGWLMPGNTRELTQAQVYSSAGDAKGFHILFNDASSEGYNYTKYSIQELLDSGIIFEFTNVKRHDFV